MVEYCPVCSCQLDDEEYKEAMTNLKKIIREREEAIKSGAKEI